VSAQRSSIIGKREHSARYRRHFAGDSSRAACKNREALALLLPPLSKLSGKPASTGMGLAFGLWVLFVALSGITGWGIL